MDLIFEGYLLDPHLALTTLTDIFTSQDVDQSFILTD
jgi:hypothetical protein